MRLGAGQSKTVTIVILQGRTSYWLISNVSQLRRLDLIIKKKNIKLTARRLHNYVALTSVSRSTVPINKLFIFVLNRIERLWCILLSGLGFSINGFKADSIRACIEKLVNLGYTF